MLEVTFLTVLRLRHGYLPLVDRLLCCNLRLQSHTAGQEYVHTSEHENCGEDCYSNTVDYLPHVIFHIKTS